jgi:hypothetical protein
MLVKYVSIITCLYNALSAFRPLLVSQVGTIYLLYICQEVVFHFVFQEKSKFIDDTWFVESEPY